MINCKLSFASKSDFLHHALEGYATETKVSLWRSIDIAEFIAIGILAVFLFKLHVRTSVLTQTSKGPVTALLTATAPTAVKSIEV